VGAELGLDANLGVDMGEGEGPGEEEGVSGEDTADWDAVGGFCPNMA
jgi:hypothetical protein